jgi:predicted acetyltransferase
LEKPKKEHEWRALDYKKEHYSSGETKLHGGFFFEEFESYDRWLKFLENPDNPNLVQCSTFFATMGSRIVGMLSIRHTLNDTLRKYGGHIGYGVRPSDRGKGYATEILKLGLEYCKNSALRKLSIMCRSENLASQRVIIKNGGVFRKEKLDHNGTMIRVYHIFL